MTNKEQQGFRPRIYLFKSFESGKWEFTQDSADERDIEYLSLEESNALLAEAVREAKLIGMADMLSKLSDEIDAMGCNKAMFDVQHLMIRERKIREKAASTEGGKGG